MSDGIAAVMSRISQIRSALTGGGGGVLGVANAGDARFGDLLSKASGESLGTGDGTAKTRSGAGATDPLERNAIGAKVARAARPLGAIPAGWPDGVPAEAEAYSAEFEAAAAATGVPIEVLLAVAWAESGFNPDAVSSAGAQGMMQLMPATGEGMGVTDPFDAGQNILGGAHYLKVQFERFGSWDLAFAAYNAGPGAVQQYGGVPPYPETRSYVEILNGYLEQMTPGPAGTSRHSSGDVALPADASLTERVSMVSSTRAPNTAEADERAGLNRQASIAQATAALAGPMPGDGHDRLAMSATTIGTALREVVPGADVTGSSVGVAPISMASLHVMPPGLAPPGTLPIGTVPAGTVPAGSAPTGVGSEAMESSLGTTGLTAAFIGTALREVVPGSDTRGSTAGVGLDRRLMELSAQHPGPGGVRPERVPPSGVAPISMASQHVVQPGLAQPGTASTGAGSEAWANGMGATGVTTASAMPPAAVPTTTAPLTSMAALPESLVALIQRSQRDGQGPQRLTVRLDPPELGRLDVLFELRGDQVAVVVRSESALAGTLMSQQRGRIAEALAQQGLMLSGFDVATGGGDGSPDRRPGPARQVYPANETDPIHPVQLTVDRALRL